MQVLMCYDTATLPEQKGHQELFDRRIRKSQSWYGNDKNLCTHQIKPYSLSPNSQPSHDTKWATGLIYRTLITIHIPDFTAV